MGRIISYTNILQTIKREFLFGTPAKGSTLKTQRKDDTFLGVKASEVLKSARIQISLSISLNNYDQQI